MKKIVFISIILALLTACSAKTSPAQSTTDQTTVTESAEQASENATEAAHFSSMDEYVRNLFGGKDEAGFSIDYMTYKVYAEQDALVYDYTYNRQYDNVAGIKATLDASYDPENETIQHLLTELRSTLDIKNPKIKYIYRNNDGTVITEQIYE